MVQNSIGLTVRDNYRSMIYNLTDHQRCYQDQGVRDQDQTGRDRDQDQGG